MNTSNLETLIKLMNDNQLQVLSIKDVGTEYHIEKAAGKLEPALIPSPVQAQQMSDTETETGHIQKSQLVGTFYATDSEDSTEPLVKQGDTVQKGDRIGIIEAMKVMNDIQAEVSGVIEELFVENGTAVDYDAPLVRIRENK
ncbi:acetyl-CoA carboxylase biotin carboxyl carrier protein [Macrococcus lamae]|uniref:Biotin carboxyl carrier protein of acetyl-CoA carboxylase n=1 Tax=Macrococcus lamae TaxID=198484 RepID=A0A4R6BTW3_9STAP|nr:biotin/lipoyl-containing protein [Macrococcus lamae]TDM10501.1 acetyl-CoA carboxylase biotin carboxyl carrier protein subunit [Macrococcus lamae]